MNKLELFEKLVKDREESHRTFQKKSMQGFAKGVVDKYSEPAHFLLEMLQNADDAGASTVKISLFENRIELLHNGKDRFTISDPENEDLDTDNGTLGHINSITSIGNTTKNESQNEVSNKIGKFGVGFKSVFQYCDEPEIYDNPFSFKIKYLFVPELIKYEESNLRETKFIFNFKPELDKDAVFNEIKKKLLGLSDNILFLNNIKEIEWDDNESSDRGTYLKDIEIKNELQYLTILESTTIENKPSEKANEFLRFFSIVEKKEISILIKIDNGKIVTRISPYPYCFFPLIGESQLFNFYFHAPFLLNDSREKVNWNIEMKEWNHKLINSLADLLCESVLKLRDNHLLDYQAFNALPINELNVDNNFYPIYAKFKELMKTEQLIPSINEGEFLYDKHALIPETKDISKNFNSEDLQKMFNRDSIDWIDKNITISGDTQRLWRFLKNTIGIEEITHSKIINNFNVQILLNKPDNWFILFYKYLGERTKELTDKIKTFKIIKLSDDSIIEPFDNYGNPKCFLPSDFKTNAILVKQCFIDDENSKKFLINMGLKEYDIIDEIKDNVLSKYNNDNLDSISEEELYEDHSKLINALKKVSSYERIMLIREIRLKRIIRGKSANSEKYEFMYPYEVYLSQKFTENSKIEDFFTKLDLIEEVIFIDEKFYELYKNNVDLLKEMGCIFEVNSYNELEKYILRFYKNPYDINRTDDEWLKDLTRLFNFCLENKAYINSINDYAIFKDINGYFRKSKELIQPNSNFELIYKSLIRINYPINGSLIDRNVKELFTNKYKSIVIELAFVNGFEIIKGEIVNNIGRYESWNFELKRKYKNTIERYDTCISEDYYLLKQEELIELKDINIMKEMWYCVSKAHNNTYFAYYRPNAKNETSHDLSTYLKILRDSAWIPTKSGEFKKPYDCRKEDLLDGFLYNDSNDWLTAIEFGKGAITKTEDYKKKEELLNSLNTNLQVIEEMKDLTNEEQLKAIKEFKEKKIISQNFPENVTTNPSRRVEKVSEEFEEAEEIIYKDIERKERISNYNGKETKEYLINLYKQDDGLFCQICEKPMPFRYKGKEYFEASQIFNSKMINKETVFNYLCLCSNCSDQFSLVKKNIDFDELKRKILNESTVVKSEYKIELNIKENIIEPAPETIRFVQKHLLDIQTILKAEPENKEEGNE